MSSLWPEAKEIVGLCQRGERIEHRVKSGHARPGDVEELAAIGEQVKALVEAAPQEIRDQVK